MYGWTIVGLLIEAYGFWLLFCEFFPTVLQFFRQVPILNRLLNLPFVKTVRETGHVLGQGPGITFPQIYAFEHAAWAFLSSERNGVLVGVWDRERQLQADQCSTGLLGCSRALGSAGNAFLAAVAGQCRRPPCKHMCRMHRISDKDGRRSALPMQIMNRVAPMGGLPTSDYQAGKLRV